MRPIAHAAEAEWVQHSPFKRKTAGSIPVGGTCGRSQAERLRASNLARVSSILTARSEGASARRSAFEAGRTRLDTEALYCGAFGKDSGL